MAIVARTEDMALRLECLALTAGDVACAKNAYAFVTEPNADAAKASNVQAAYEAEIEARYGVTYDTYRRIADDLRL